MKKRFFGILLCIAMVITAILNPMVTVAAEAVEAVNIAQYRVADGNHKVPQAPSGKVFAGWYTDDTYTTPIPESQLDGIAVPKWVDRNVLSAKWQMTTGTTIGSNTTNLRLVTTVDSRLYKQVGFIINNGTANSKPIMSDTVYSTITGMVNGVSTTYYPNEAFCESSKYFMVCEIMNVPNNMFASILTITPQWETLDGTVVTGTASNFKINEAAGSFIRSARVTSNVSVSSLNSVADGNFNTGSWRQGTDIAGDYIQFNWDNPVSVNKFIMTVSKARNCAPTAYRIQVSKDGESNWTDVSSVSNIAWTQAGDVKETSELTFSLQSNIKGLRVLIDGAYLAWGGYTIQEIEAYNDSALYGANYASTSTVTSNTGSSNLTNLVNGDYGADCWRSLPNGDYYQFNWENPVSVNKVVMVTSKSHYTLPSAWSVEVSKDGVNDWTEVSSISGLSSYEYGDVKAKTELIFAHQENIKGIRVCIKGNPTNTGWNGYGIREIEFYQALDLNYALISTVTTNTGASNLTNLVNGNYSGDTWRSGTPNGDYYQFNWNNPVSVDKVAIFTSKSHYTLPTAWHVEVSVDGQTGWTEVASVSGLSSYEYGEKVESNELTFDVHDNIKGIRVYIDGAPTNTGWSGYGIREIEIHNDLLN